MTESFTSPYPSFELIFRYLSIQLRVLLRADSMNYILQTQGKKIQMFHSIFFSKEKLLFPSPSKGKKKVVLTTNHN